LLWLNNSPIEKQSISLSGKIILNPGFKSTKKKILLPFFSATENKAQAIRNEEEDRILISKQRDMQLDSSIVRFMKGKKEAVIGDLCSGVAKLLQNIFIPSIQDIKRRLEGLIEREYVKRDPKNMNKFYYCPL